MAADLSLQNNRNALPGRPAKIRAAPMPDPIPFVIVIASTSEEAEAVFKSVILYRLRSVIQNQAKKETKQPPWLQTSVGNALPGRRPAKIRASSNMPDPTLENFIREYILAQHLANPNKLLVYMIRPFSSMVVLVKLRKGKSSAEEQREGNHHYKLPNASPSPHFFPSRVSEHNLWIAIL